jgi:hypothetical protein
MASNVSPARSVHAQRNGARLRLFGLLMIVAGIAGWWYNHHLAATAGKFYIRLTVLGPLGLFGGLLMLLRPEWAGPWRADSTQGKKAAMIAVIGLMAVGSGIDFYFLDSSKEFVG